MDYAASEELWEVPGLPLVRARGRWHKCKSGLGAMMEFVPEVALAQTEQWLPLGGEQLYWASLFFFFFSLFVISLFITIIIISYFISIIKLLFQPMDFTFSQFSLSHQGLGWCRVWMSSCMVLSCWLGLNHKSTFHTCRKFIHSSLLSHCHANTKETLSMVFTVPKLWVHLNTKSSCKDVGISDICFYKILQCRFQRLSLKHGEVQNNLSEVVLLETRKCYTNTTKFLSWKV